MSETDTRDEASRTQIDEMMKVLPAQLYRYASLSGERSERMRKLLVESKLFCISPSRFNDPLDCKIPHVLEGTKKQIRDYVRGVIKRQDPGLSSGDIKIAAKCLLDEIKTMEWKAAFDARNQATMNRRGIVSLSTEPDNMLMWSYYADSHKGIAIRFNMENIAKTSEFLIPIQVKYLHEMPTNNFRGTELNEFGYINTAFGSKSIAWAHEKEWRLVKTTGEGLIDISPDLIDGVILGMNIEPEIEANIRDWIDLRGSPTEWLRVAHKRNSFDLELVPA